MERKQGIICVIISVVYILFVTLFSRIPTLSRATYLIPLWSYASHGHGKQIILNVCLFIPLGYFLASAFSTSKHPRLWPILLALFVSAAVETVQFLTYRGTLDVDDLTSNGLGAAVGLLIYTILDMHKQGGQAIKWMSGVLIAAGFAGCIMVAVSSAKSNISTRITKQFQFSISSVAVENGRSTIEGECFLYDRATPAYTLLVGGSEASTTIVGKMFIATIDQPGGKAEVEIRFKGFPVMPTGTWINDDKVEYVGGIEPLISSMPETAVLKAYSPDFDTLVYQDCDRIRWLIGTEIDKNTEIIYHIHTDEPEKLPENRVQYGFDNRGFRAGTERRDNELNHIDHYRVFEREIPQEYNVTAIVIGLNTDGTITWNDSFRIE